MILGTDFTNGVAFMEAQLETRSVWHPVLRFALGVVALSVIRVVAGTLPLLQELLLPGFSISALELVRMALSTVMLVLVFQCGRELATRLQGSFPGFPEVGRLVNYLVLYGVLVGGYRAFLPLATVFLLDLLLIYQLTFFVMAGVPLILLVVALLQHLSKLSDIVAGGFRQALQVPAAERCTVCNAQLNIGDRFCASCGTSREKASSQ